jgi:hypothetical protein
MKRSKHTCAPLHGLYPKNFSLAVRERAEIDYLNKLPAAERAWLAKFNDEWAGGKFGSDPLHTDAQQRREIWRDLSYVRSDSYTQKRRALGKDYDQICERDLREWDEDPAHCAAVAELTLALPPPPKRKNGKVAVSREYQKARAKLVRLNKKSQEQLFHPEVCWADLY